MYTALTFLFVGLSMASSFWPLVVLLLIMILFFFRVVGREEAMMIERFGEKYRTYMKRTGRFLPRLRRIPG